MRVKLPIYLSKLIKKHPTILSGRKNFKQSHLKILKTKKIIKTYYLSNK